MKVLKALGWYLLGFVLVPVILACTPKGAKKLRWLDSVYGNRVDGLDGDAHYRAKRFRRFRWLQLRNPVNNLLRSYGPNGTIVRIQDMPHGVDYWIEGRRWWFRKYRIAGRLHLIFGYPSWGDNRLNSQFDVGHHFEQRMLLWPIKML